MNHPRLCTLLVLSFIMGVLLASAGTAINEVTIFTTRLNWFDGNDTDSTRGHNRTFLVGWAGGAPALPAVIIEVYLNNTGSSPFNFTVADNCGFGASTANCTCSSQRQKANCTLFANGTLPFGVTWNGTPGPMNLPELTLSVSGANATNGTTNTFYAANLSWLRIPESKVWHTLVEFGRGRGNYFFDSAGRETSAGVGTGQPYLPNGSRIELNYLHKAFNVRQYYGLATEKAENATWSCLYPNASVVRNHLTTAISRGAGVFNATFKIPEIEGSFERQGFIAQQFEPSDMVVGSSLIINCTNFAYTLGNASGNISVDRDDFNLSVRDREPINFTASTGTASIGLGTQEVLINYTIQNKEVFPVTEVVAEIGAPLHSKFIGTRAELFGVADEKYVLRRSLIPARGNESIELVARFNTTNADAGLTALNLSGPSRISVVNPWDKNAYNPAETIYAYQDQHTVTVNLAVAARVEPLTDVLQLTRNLTNITLRLNESLFAINSSIRDVLQGINASMQLINSTLVDRLAGINTSLQRINESLFDFLTSFNRTIVAQLQNLTNITIETNRSVNSILQNISAIRVRLDHIEEFENELVFLVTDSFGMEQAAIKQVNEGKVGDAVESMKQANQDLVQLANRIAEERTLALAEPSSYVTAITAVSEIEPQDSPQWSSLMVLNLFAVVVLLVGAAWYAHRALRRPGDEDYF